MLGNSGAEGKSQNPGRAVPVSAIPRLGGIPVRRAVLQSRNNSRDHSLFLYSLFCRLLKRAEALATFAAFSGFYSTEHPSPF
jgi:hypothetical protein